VDPAATARRWITKPVQVPVERLLPNIARLAHNQAGILFFSRDFSTTAEDRGFPARTTAESKKEA
jgi:hypothetical protein